MDIKTKVQLQKMKKIPILENFFIHVDCLLKLVPGIDLALIESYEN